MGVYNMFFKNANYIDVCAEFTQCICVCFK